jgi:hypothetical protein
MMMKLRSLTFAGAIAAISIVGSSADAASRLPKGQHLKCLDEGRLCVGMKVGDLPGYEFSLLGKFNSVYCGVSGPSIRGSPNPDPLGRVLSHGCGDSFIATFVDGRCVSGVSVRDGVIVNLSHDCRALFDFSA